MKRFAELFSQLDQTTKTNRKLELLEDYFKGQSGAEAAWSLYFLCGHKLKRLVKTKTLRQAASELVGIADWLFDECYEVVGDLAETLSLIVEQAGLGVSMDQARAQTKATSQANSSEPIGTLLQASQPLSLWIVQVIQPLSQQSEAEQKHSIQKAWGVLSATERLVFNKLLTGSFRVGVSQTLVVRALASTVGVHKDAITHRLMGQWSPSEQFYESLIHEDTQDVKNSQPYPFMLANPLDQPFAQSLDQPVGQYDEPSHWQAEWKWDGIRAQVIRRGGETFIWSRGEELMTERFPELLPQLNLLPDGTVLDGEVLAVRDGQILPFLHLQRRIGLKRLTKKVLADVPVSFFAFDLLEFGGHDIRELPLRERRDQLLSLNLGTQNVQGEEEQFRLGSEPTDSGSTGKIFVPPAISFSSWDELAELRQRCREQFAEGVVLKRLDSAYRPGRPRGLWWKWKIDPFSVDAVMIYAQRGHGRRAGLYSDYTFAVWKDGQLVPFAKAYSGLTDEEMKRVDAFVRKNTLEKFGPMVKVKPELVFELAFENIQLSSRHKSGFAVRFPRIQAWRHDKRPDQADTIERIKSILTSIESATLKPNHTEAARNS